jgi:DnaJ-class molecular chaperone
MLSDPEAKKAYDRLAAAKFEEHQCAQHGARPNFGGEETFAERARKLVMRGFKPKDAVEIVLQEISLEHRKDVKKIEQARLDGEDFLRRVKSGLI